MPRPSKGVQSKRTVRKITAAHAKELRTYLHNSRQEKPEIEPYYRVVRDSHVRFTEEKKAGKREASWGECDILAWLELKKLYPVQALDFEGEFYEKRAGEKLYVQPDRSLTKRRDNSKKRDKRVARHKHQNPDTYKPQYNTTAIPTAIEEFGEKDGSLIDGHRMGWKNRPQQSLRQDVEWAAEYSTRSDFSRNEIPSGRALYLLALSRHNVSAFSNILSKFIPSASRVAQEEEMRRSEQVVFDMVDDAVEAAAKSAEIDNDVAIHDVVADELGDGWK